MAPAISVRTLSPEDIQELADILELFDGDDVLTPEQIDQLRRLGEDAQAILGNYPYFVERYENGLLPKRVRANLRSFADAYRDLEASLQELGTGERRELTTHWHSPLAPLIVDLRRTLQADSSVHLAAVRALEDTPKRGRPRRLALEQTIFKLVVLWASRTKEPKPALRLDFVRAALRAAEIPFADNPSTKSYLGKLVNKMASRAEDLGLLHHATPLDQPGR